MPLARISVPNILPTTKVRKLADAVHKSLVATCDVPEQDRFQLISTFEAAHMIIDPTFPDVKRTREASIVEILFLEGRSAAQKVALFESIANSAVEAKFSADDIMIALCENAVIDWSLGGGSSYGLHHAPDGGMK
ncbi:MAG: tautomerase family protein [Hyphomicrobiales bacterium]